MGRAKRKSAFEHAQNVQIHIILRMRKVSFGRLLSIHTFCSIQWFILLAVGEGPDQTARMRRLIRHSLSTYAWWHIFAEQDPLLKW